MSVACCFSPVGNYVPPFSIFHAFECSIISYIMFRMVQADFDETGWMNAETFIKWLKHFIAYIRPSNENHILLLMDNHSLHVTLKAVNLCRENQITILGFPTHTSHRMQPLDLAFYGPFKTTYSRVCNHFLMEHLGQTISINDVAGLSYWFL